jgi:DNA-binding response OmpR family regulator
MRVLIAEDDDFIRKGLAEIFRMEGFEIIEAADGEAAVHRFYSETVDFVCLDIMMPKKSGYDVLKEIRKHNTKIPVMFVTAKSEEIDTVLGLELGADDVIVKPFGVKEVAARIRAVTRRTMEQMNPDEPVSSFRIGDLTVTPAKLRAERDGSVIELSLRETEILRLFAKNEGKVLSKQAIFDQCWSERFFPLSRTLDQHISKLRKRIEKDPQTPKIIKTVHGVGYRYDKG